MDDHDPVGDDVDEGEPFEHLAEEIEQEVVVVLHFHFVLFRERISGKKGD